MTRHTAHSIGMEISRYHKVSSTNRVAGSYKFFTQHLFRTMDHIDTNRSREYLGNLNSTSGVKGAGCKLFPRLRRGFGGQVNSLTLVKKN